MLITFFLTSILPLGLMALLSYNKARLMAFMDPQEVFQSMLNLTIFLVVIGISASIVLSRQFAISIVDPIKDIEKAMTRVENGDLTASVLVRSNDELGAMAENFNKMVDVLRERSRIQQSLNMAMEVQQNLLPKTLPRIRGIDMAGACSYCDETGGDYFDILCSGFIQSGQVQRRGRRCFGSRRSLGPGHDNCPCIAAHAFFDVRQCRAGDF